MSVNERCGAGLHRRGAWLGAGRSLTGNVSSAFRPHDWRAKWREGVKSQPRAVLSPGPVARWGERLLAWRRGLITGVMLRCEQLIRKAQSTCALRGLAGVKETK